MAPFYGWGSITSRLQSHYEEAVYLSLAPKVALLVEFVGHRWKIYTKDIP